MCEPRSRAMIFNKGPYFLPHASDKSKMALWMPVFCGSPQIASAIRFILIAMESAASVAPPVSESLTAPGSRCFRNSFILGPLSGASCAKHGPDRPRQNVYAEGATLLICLCKCLKLHFVDKPTVAAFKEIVLGCRWAHPFRPAAPRCGVHLLEPLRNRHVVPSK